MMPILLHELYRQTMSICYNNKLSANMQYCCVYDKAVPWIHDISIDFGPHQLCY